MIPARQSTALELSIGPVLDADGVAVTDCVVGDFKIKKTTGNFAALNGSATLTHVSAGTYDLVLTTSDTDTVGLCSIAIDDTTNACAPVYLQVIEEVIYDALYAASANAFTGAAGSTKVTGVVLTDTLTTYTGNTPQTGDSFARLTGTGAVTLASLTVSGATTLTGAVVGTNASNDLRINGISPGSANGLAIAGSNAATTYASMTLTGALSIGNGIIVTTSTTDRSALSLTGNGEGHGISAISGAGSNAAGVSISSAAGKGVNILSNGTVGIQITAATNGIDIDTTNGHGFDLSGIAGASKYGISGTIDGVITSSGLASQASVNTIDDFLDTEIAAILADTNELQTDWANGGRLDLLLDAVVADNPNTPTKNVALADLVFTMVDATDFNTPETGVTVTATISKDGGAFASCTNAVSEISGGFYKISLTQTEMNADSIALKFTGTGCAQRNFSFRTQPT